MQRIKCVTFNQADTAKMQLYSQYNTFLQLLSPHVSTRSLSVLAKPQFMADSSQLGWYTNLEGQPTLISDIADESVKKGAEITLKKRLSDIDGAIKQLISAPSITSDQKNLLTEWFRRVSSNYNVIYVINDDPVVIYNFDQPAPAPIITNIPKTFPRWWHYLLLLLLLLGLLGLLWYFFCPMSVRNKPVDIIPPVEVQVTPEPEVVPEPIPEPVPEPIPEPVPEPIPEPIPEPVPEPIPEPVVEPQPEAKPVVKNDPNCVKKETITKNKNPSRMVLIFDNSASMHLTLAESQAEIERYLNTDFRFMSKSQVDDYDNRMTRLPNRLSSSKKVAKSSIDKIQSNVDIGLVVLNKCSTADKIGFFGNKNRDALKKKITQLEPLTYNSATPLYSGVEVASSMLDGVNRDDYILIISDGEDNCSNYNICTLAFSIAQKKPRLKINIVDIAGLHKIDCVANATGGKVFIAKNNQQLINQMNNAVKQMDISKPICK